jgi:predicted PurR-regulated permease PerM
MGEAEEGRFYARVFWLVAGGLLAVALFAILRPFLESILWAGLLALLINPLNDLLSRKLGGRPGLAALILSVAGALFVLIPAVVTGIIFAGQATELLSRLERLAERYRIAEPSDLLQVPALDQVLRWIGKFVPVPPVQLRTWLLDGGRSLLSLVLASSGAVVAGVVGLLFEVGLTLFLLFFFLRDGRAAAARLSRLVPLSPQRKADLAGHLSAITRAVAFGTLLTALVQGTLVGLSFAFVGLSSPVFFTVVASLAALVPLVGSSLVWVPAAITLAVDGRLGAAAFLVFWGMVVVSLVDNIVRPLVVTGRAQISTLPVLLGLMGGLAAFGTIGIVLGPVVIALGLALLRFAEEERAV